MVDMAQGLNDLEARTSPSVCVSWFVALERKWFLVFFLELGKWNWNGAWGRGQWRVIRFSVQGEQCLVPRMASYGMGGSASLSLATGLPGPHL